MKKYKATSIITRRLSGENSLWTWRCEVLYEIGCTPAGKTCHRRGTKSSLCTIRLLSFVLLRGQWFLNEYRLMSILNGLKQMYEWKPERMHVFAQFLLWALRLLKFAKSASIILPKIIPIPILCRAKVDLPSNALIVVNPEYTVLQKYLDAAHFADDQYGIALSTTTWLVYYLKVWYWNGSL